MSLISIALWGAMFFMLGLGVFFCLPVLGPSLPIALRRQLGGWYYDLSAKAFERVLCYVKKTNEATLVRPTWDPDHEAETTDIGDATSYYQDPANKERRLNNKPFSFVLSDLNKIISPLDAMVGKHLRQRRENNDEWIEFDAGDGSTVRAFNAHVTLPRAPVGVDLQHARAAFGESHEPDDVENCIEYVKKSQLGYKTTNAFNMIMLLMAMGAGAGLAWLIWSNSSVGGDSVVNVPLIILGGGLL